MISVHDVAAYILQKQGTMTTMKLQKLVYYSQAWSLVWDEKPLFAEKIEAWANGPVVRALYDKHKTMFNVSKWKWGTPTSILGKRKTTIDAVLKFYGRRTSQWLSDLTHREDPWTNARKGLGLGDRGSNIITLSSMMEYYSSL